MSFSLNKVLIVGNLVSDPTLRATPSGTPVGDLRIAINRRYKDNFGEWQKDTVYITVVVWGKTAENCKRYLTTGRAILVEGRLVQDNWKAADGSNRSQIKLSAEKVTFMPQTSKSGSDGEMNADSNADIAGDIAADDDSLPF